MERSREKKIIHGTYKKVGDSIHNLIKAVESDFWGVENINEDTCGVEEEVSKDVKKNPIVQDIFNNIIAINEIPQLFQLNDNGVCEGKKTYTKEIVIVSCSLIVSQQLAFKMHNRPI